MKTSRSSKAEVIATLLRAGKRRLANVVTYATAGQSGRWVAYRGSGAAGLKSLRPSLEGVYGPGIYFYAEPLDARAYAERGGGVLVAKVHGTRYPQKYSSDIIVAKSTNDVHVLGTIPTERTLDRSDYLAAVQETLSGKAESGCKVATARKGRRNMQRTSARANIIATLLRAGKRRLANVVAYATGVRVGRDRHQHFVDQVVATLIRAKRSDLLYDFLVLSMSFDTAKKLLGFDEQETPSVPEVERAWKKKALEHHPDRGGDPEMMKQINIAHDVLTGKQKPDRGDGGSRPGPSETTRWTPPKATPERISWDEAARDAHVPTSGVEWKFATEKGYGGYGTDARNESKSGWVVYGRSDREHIFVSIFEHRLEDLYSGIDRDIVKMLVRKYPLTQDLAVLAPKVIREMWKDFGDIKAYNAKVRVLEPDVKFDKGFSHRLYKLRSVSFKNAMGLLGAATPTAWKGKVDVTIELGGDRPEYPKDFEATLVVNGKPYKLSAASNALLWKARFYSFVFGAYYYGGSKKNLTRIKEGKKALTFLADKLRDEPQELIDALKAAAEKAK